MGVIAASSRGVSFTDSPWINSASSAPFELVIASQVILYRLTGLTILRRWESRSKGSGHMDLSMQIYNNAQNLCCSPRRTATWKREKHACRWTVSACTCATHTDTLACARRTIKPKITTMVLK